MKVSAFDSSLFENYYTYLDKSYLQNKTFFYQKMINVAPPDGTPSHPRRQPLAKIPAPKDSQRGAQSEPLSRSMSKRADDSRATEPSGTGVASVYNNVS